MMRRKRTSRRVQTLSPDSLRSDDIASTDIAWSLEESCLFDIRGGLVTNHANLRSLLTSRSNKINRTLRRANAILRRPAAQASGHLLERTPNGDQIRASDRNARHAATRDHPLRPRA